MRRFAILTLVAVSLLWAPVLRADDDAEPQASGTEVESEAVALIQALADRLAAAQSLRVAVETTWEVVQRDGVRLEFGADTSMFAERPDRFGGKGEGWGGDVVGASFDGKTITAFDDSEKVYAQVEHPGTIDQALDFLDNEWAHSVQLGHLFRNDVAQRTRAGLEVDGITFVSCGEVWYERCFRGGEVVNLVVEGPPGY